MEANKILTASLLDLVFDTRNKAYGAYELRSSYNKRIRISLLVAAGLVLLIIAGSAFAKPGTTTSKAINIKSVNIDDLKVEEEKPVLIPPKPQPEPEPVRTEKLTTLKIVDDDQVKEPPPTQEDLVGAKIDLKSQEGKIDDNFAQPADLDKGTGIIEARKVKEPEVWEKVEVDAAFPGGIKKWLQFLERNCNGQVASDNGAAVGRYTVVIRFVVDVNGELSDIRPQTNIGFGMEEEAMKVIKKAGAMKWIPASQNGRQVKAYRTQPITFLVEE